MPAGPLCRRGRAISHGAGAGPAAGAEPSHAGDGLGGTLNKEDALASFDRAIAADPTLADTHSARADLLAELGRREEAIVGYDRALALREAQIDWLNRGATLNELSRHKEAVASFDRAISLQPDFVEAMLNRAAALARLGRNEAAITDCDKVLGQDAGNTVAQNMRAGAEESRRYQEALAAYEAVLAIDLAACGVE